MHTHKTRKAPPEFAAAFVTADTHADLNGVVRHTLEVSKVSFATDRRWPLRRPAWSRAACRRSDCPMTGRCSSTEHVLSIPKLYLGSGIRPSKLVVDGSIFADIPGVRCVPGLGKPLAARRRAGAGRVAQVSRILDENVNFLCLQ